MSADDRLGRIRAAFERQADKFDKHAEIADLSVEDRFACALGAHATGRILDVACGPGVVTAALAAKAEAVVGLDATEAMLAKARARAEALPNVSFQSGDAQNLPFTDASFDGVVTRLAIHHFEDPARAVAEMRRVLKPGGRLVIVDVVVDEDAEKAGLQNAVEILRDPSHVRMLPPSELDALVADAGFVPAATETWDKDRRFDEWMGIANDAKLVQPLKTVVRALAEAGRDAGMGLRPDGDDVAFFHRWRLVAADRPL